MDPDARRDAAIARLQAKRRFTNQVVAYLAVNLVLVVIWVIAGGGFFWPVVILLGWGVALAAQAWSLFRAEPITEADVEREIAKESRDVA